MKRLPSLSLFVGDRSKNIKILPGNVKKKIRSFKFKMHMNPIVVNKKSPILNAFEERSFLVDSLKCIVYSK